MILVPRLPYNGRRLGKLGVLTGNNCLTFPPFRWAILPFCYLVKSESLIPKTLLHMVWAIFETPCNRKDEGNRTNNGKQTFPWIQHLILILIFCSLFHTPSHVWVCICINAENKGPYKYSFICKQGYSLLFQKCLPSVYKASVAKSHSRKISWIPAGQWYPTNNAH